MLHKFCQIVTFWNWHDLLRILLWKFIQVVEWKDINSFLLLSSSSWYGLEVATIESSKPGRASLVAQRVKHLPAMWETQVWSPGLMEIMEISWRRKCQPTPVLLPGKFHGQRRLVSYSPWNHKESHTTEQFYLSNQEGSGCVYKEGTWGVL